MTMQAYTVTVRTDATTGPEFTADRHTVGAITVGEPVCSGIEPMEPMYDVDWIAVDLDAGQTYVIDLEGRATNAGTLFDPILSGMHTAREGAPPGVIDRVMGSPRGIWDDNDGDGKNSRLLFTVVEPGR